MTENYGVLEGVLVEDVSGSVYPATGPLPSGRAIVRTAGQLGHPEEWRRARPKKQTLERAALLTGRAIYGGYFLYNGINHFLKRKMVADYARAKGVPAADAAVLASGLMIIAGGASIMLGLRPKLGAGLISGFLLGVSPQMHAFWKEADPQQRMNEMVNFTKNMALVGASLFAAAQPEPWPLRAAGRNSTRQSLAPIR